jgi:hypothetical protein
MQIQIAHGEAGVNPRPLDLISFTDRTNPYKKIWTDPMQPQDKGGDGVFDITFLDRDGDHWALCGLTIETSERIINVDGG